MNSGAGSVLRWTGSSLLWLCAPVAGLAALNLPGFWTRLSQDPTSNLFANTTYVALAALPPVIWGAGVLWIAHSHCGRAKLVHLAVSLALFVLGLALIELYKLAILIFFMLLGT